MFGRYNWDTDSLLYHLLKVWFTQITERDFFFFLIWPNSNGVHSSSFSFCYFCSSPDTPEWSCAGGVESVKQERTKFIKFLFYKIYFLLGLFRGNFFFYVLHLLAADQWAEIDFFSYKSLSLFRCWRGCLMSTLSLLSPVIQLKWDNLKVV